MGNPRLSQPVSIGPISLEFVPVFFSNANVEQGVPHKLPSVPTMAVIAKADKKCIIWAGQTPWGTNAVQLICDTDGVNAVLLIMSLDLSER